MACRLAADELASDVTNYLETVYRPNHGRPEQLQPASKTKGIVVQTPISSVKEPQVPIRYEDAEFC